MNVLLEAQTPTNNLIPIIVNISVNVFCWLMVMLFFKKLFNHKGVIPLAKKIVSLGLEGIWEFIKPHIGLILKILVIIYMFFIFIPESSWKTFWEKLGHTLDWLKDLGWQPKQRPELFKIIITVFIILPFKTLLVCLAYLFFPIVAIQSWLGATRFGLDLKTIIGLIILSMWIAAIWKAANKQYYRQRDKENQALSEEIDAIKKEMKNESN